ncbi:urea ABC transporter permease subunit UrtC [Rhodovibrio salinarum]|uniref:Urea ABC transporter permease subunit UrtC n=1 Tax=Rhodovibrio salinarum TaxID=1087 RepID=A0A934QJG2_9PROT|nr:urea ABC transporter permease subunit UrtC [Rhodovibrio salinarum]MBK1698198.1 urea ABC transporter permease subunit UrtC [Rhodovibrio salinarum]
MTLKPASTRLPAAGVGRLPGRVTRADLALLALLLFVLFGVPALNLLPDGSALRLPDYMIGVLGKFWCFAMLALAHGLLWGYAGPLSLGHGAFFGLGGYCMGMYLAQQKAISAGNQLPEFMVFLNWDHLPWWWTGTELFPVALLFILGVPGLLAFVFGYFTFRSRISGVYFSIISQAMVFALMLAFSRSELGFGGKTGLTNFSQILGFSVADQGTRIGIYMVTVLALAGSYLLCRWIVRSKLGQVLIAIREAEERVRFLGYPADRVKLFVFVLSAMIAGLGGALYVPQAGIINPSEFEPAQSIEVAAWVAVGGRGTLVGPILGALGVNAAKSWLTGVAPELWLFFLGALFIAVTLFLPKGLAGVWPQIRASLAKQRGGGHG